MRVSKGKAMENNGKVFSHLSSLIPAKTAIASAASNCEPRLANFIKNCLLLGDGLLFIGIHLHYVGAHAAFAIKGGSGLQLQFTCIQVSFYNTIAA